jgi:hypothetical protein
MKEFFQAGGFPMFFVLFFGAATFVAAIVFAFRADLRKLALVRALTNATIFSMVSGVLADFLAVTRHVASHSEELIKSGELGVIVMIGLGESVTPGILGFTFLSLAWVVVAVGTRRVQELGE